MAPPQSDSIPSEGLALNPQHSRLLALAWQCFESEPKIDYEKLSRLSGYTVGSAKVTVGTIKRKMRIAAGEDVATKSSSPSKGDGVTATTPRKRKSTTHGDEQGSSKKRGKKGQAAAAPANLDDDDEEFERSPIRKSEHDAILAGASAYLGGVKKEAI
ncbi:hypothetical protein K432DRAFT_399681 [Lepidopterella palustris CBS 459.81]|uniref:Uncharacterized protein n=1 Tax=Lepidopterella palustris CBS 459.81 TaxID=1314670 RepID=A0A8E2ELQ4_9PEZI|nr:hypothetical protein K432DRAFT_399681 [Lepidopterella palustris CBS 459.81]